MVNDILAGHLMLGVGTPPTYLPLQKDKRITALVTMSTTRLSLLPEVPTVAEAVGFTGFDVSTWYALSGPAKMPRPILEKLQLDIQKVLADPEMKRRILDLAINQSPDSSPERTGAVMRAYSEQMGKLIIQAGIKKIVTCKPREESSWLESFSFSKEMFDECGIEIDYI